MVTICIFIMLVTHTQIVDSVYKTCIKHSWHTRMFRNGLHTFQCGPLALCSDTADVPERHMCCWRISACSQNLRFHNYSEASPGMKLHHEVTQNKVCASCQALMWWWYVLHIFRKSLISAACNLAATDINMTHWVSSERSHLLWEGGAARGNFK